MQELSERVNVKPNDNVQKFYRENRLEVGTTWQDNFLSETDSNSDSLFELLFRWKDQTRTFK